MDATDRKIGGLAVLTSLVVGAAGGFLGRSVFEQERERAGHQAPVVDLDQVEALLVGLQDRVAEVSRQVAELADTRVASDREPLTPEAVTTDLEELRELVERLEQALARSTSLAHGSLTIPAGRPEPIPSETSDEAARAEIRRRFQLMSYQQVLDTLGRPDLVSLTKYGNADAVLWSYARPGQGELGRSFHVYLSDGLVIDVAP